MVYVGLDVGSTSIKCALLDTDTAKVQETGRLAFPAPMPGLPAGRYEVRVHALYAQCRELIGQALMQCPQAAGILLSTQMHGYALTDAGGADVGGYVTWRDGAGLEPGGEGRTFLEELREKTAGLRGRTGAPLRPKLAAVSLYARRRQGLEVRAGMRFHTLGGYLIYRLCGEHVCHLSTAAATGLCDVTGAAWDERLIACTGAQGVAFPRIVRGADAVGEYAFNGRMYPLHPDFGDHQACVLGSLARPVEDVNVNIGTGGMVGRIVQGFERGVESRPLLEDYFIRTITGLPAGRHLQGWLAFVRREFGWQVSDAELWECLTQLSEPPEEGVRVDILGQEEFALRGADAGAQECTRALYAHIAQSYAQAVRGLGGEVRRLVYSGGAVLRNPALRSHLERACRLPGVAGDQEAVMRGLLLLALLSQGEYSTLPLAQNALVQRAAKSNAAQKET